MVKKIKGDRNDGDDRDYLECSDGDVDDDGNGDDEDDDDDDDDEEDDEYDRR